MTYYVSSTGSIITLRASTTFPVGIVLSAFPEDSDPFNMEAVTTAAAVAGMNGDVQAYTIPV